MTLLTNTEREYLINLLARMPGIEQPETRQLLTANQSPELQHSLPDATDAQHYLTLLVDALEQASPPPDAGTLPILLLIEQAMWMCGAASPLTNELEALLIDLAVRAQPGGQTDVPAVLSDDDEEPTKSIMVDLFYATDRASTGDTTPTKFYGNRRSEAVALGTCKVSIPIRHTFGQVESPSFLRLEFSRNPSKHFVLSSLAPLDEGSFFAGLHARVAQSSSRAALVFIHGFNTSFEDAAYRAAQIAHDLQFDGAPIMYSWASKGEPTPFGYSQDAQTIQSTGLKFATFLEAVAAQSGATQIYVIAHSMGNQALVRALEKIANTERAQPSALFEHVLLAAPDVDVDLFQALAANLRKAANHVTIYASSKDKALIASKFYQGYPRVGDTSEKVVIVSGIDTIDASAVDTDFLGHGYYSDTRSVLKDIAALLKGMIAPDSRPGLAAKLVAAGKYWIFNP